MSLSHTVLALGLAGLVFVASPARGASMGQQAGTPPSANADDTTLKSRVAANLKKNATTAARDIDVDVHEGIVTLKGVVRTTDEKARAARLATIKGVTEVRNELVVDAAAARSRTGKAIDTTAHAGEKGADVAKGAAHTTGDKATQIAGATAKKTQEVAAGIGETITDSWITTKLKAKFFDETLLKHSDIHVETNDHVVTLTGTVASSTAKTRAEAITSGTEGMTRVVNQLSREAAVAIVTMAALARILAADICR
jgi:osmotically-inducible protein OsmY